MMPDATYISDPILASARHLQRAGQWDLALAVISTVDSPLARDLRAEILVERNLWRRDSVDEALAAIEQASSPLGDLLLAQLAYYRMLFEDGDPLDADVEATYRAHLGHPAMGAKIRFQLGVYQDNVLQDAAAAQESYAFVQQNTSDPLLESYVVRHQAGHAPKDDQERLLRRSMNLRAAWGARPLIAAAQSALANVLGEDDPEAKELREMVAYTAAELNLTWLR